MIIKKKLVHYILSGVGTFALVAGMVSPVALASLTVNINGNGADSGNDAAIQLNQQTTIVQQNDVDITNDLHSQANTGNNTVSENVGDAHITTGDITDNVAVKNTVGANVATGTLCGGCANGDLTIGIEKNGAASDSAVSVSSTTGNAVYQTNNGKVTNDVKTDLNTGYNSSKKNVGDSYITTGDIKANTALDTTYGYNKYAGIKGTSGLDGTITVKGNGAYADVDVSIALDHLNEFLQSNDFWIVNNIYEKHNTGDNDCKKNVGDCHITTGDISSEADVDNQGGENGIGGTEDPDVDDKDPDPKDPKDPNGGTDTPDEKTIIDKIIDKLIPDVEAAVSEESTDDEVLGAAQLPMTGIGAMPTVLWKEILLAMYAVAAGLYLRHLFGRLERRYSTNVRV